VPRGFSFQVRESSSLICDHSPSQMEHNGLIGESGPVLISKLLQKGGCHPGLKAPISPALTS